MGFLKPVVEHWLEAETTPGLELGQTLNRNFKSFCDEKLTAIIFKQGRKVGNVLFNDTLNTFYLQLYGVKHMVKDHSNSEKGNLLPPHRLLFPINSKGYFICTITQTG